MSDSGAQKIMRNAFSSTRRELLRFGTLQLGGLWLPSLLQARAAAGTLAAPRRPAKACILLFLDGGPSQLDMWDMKPEAPSEIRGPFRPISTTVPGVQVCEHLPGMARSMRHAAIVRSMRHDEMVHPPAVSWALTGSPPPKGGRGGGRERRNFPHVGTAFGLADPTPTVMPKVISLPEVMKIDAYVIPGQDAGYLGPGRDPLWVPVTPDLQVVKPDLFMEQAALPAERVARRVSLLEQVAARRSALPEYRDLDAIQQQALSMLTDPKVATAFDLEREPPKVRERYGTHRQGQCTLLARRLVEAGTRFVSVYWGREKQYWADGVKDREANNPWDTHRNHFPLLKDELMPRADQAFSALVEDLAERGMLAETLVVWMGEFGRSPEISKFASREHWPYAYSLVLAGGGIRGGAVYGRTDATSSEVVESPVAPADLSATILHALGVDPRQTVRDLQGRPYPLSDGEPIHALFG